MSSARAEPQTRTERSSTARFVGHLQSQQGMKLDMSEHVKNRQDPAAFQCWHPDGRPFTDADYEKANLPVPTLEQLAHWAETERWIADLKRLHDVD